MATETQRMRERAQQIAQKFFSNLKYESSRGLGERGLQAHHVKQFTDSLVPVFAAALAKAKLEEAKWWADGDHTANEIANCRKCERLAELEDIAKRV
jgi:hypothetical protein